MKKKSMLILTILLMSIGFAAVSTNLATNGYAIVSENIEDFSIAFTSATLDGKDVYSSVVDSTKKIMTFETSQLKTLNQTSVMAYEITNNSRNYDIEISVTCTPKEGTTTPYTSISNKLDNDVTKILAKGKQKGTLTVTLNKVPTSSITAEYTCKLDFTAVERDTLADDIPESISFSSDSWATIAANVKSGNTSNYNVGDTKEIDLGDLGTHPVRIANMSACTNGETSETACGFVVEFADIIIRNAFNSTATNVGGWKDSEMRTYVNETIYNALPSDLQDVIVTTKVISSHGSTSGETNFETQDKLYLLNAEEVWGSNSYDTSVGSSKQLDYYKNLGVTASSYAGAKKQISGSNAYWRLRSADSSNVRMFLAVNNAGGYNSNSANNSHGVSPAFRIA